MGNLFWREVFVSTMAVMQGAIFCFPEKILLSPFWDNPALTRNEKPIKGIHFPEISQKIKVLSDFYKPNTNKLFSKQELESRFELNIPENTYTELRFIINSAVQKVGLRPENLPIIQLPQQPLLVNIATLTKKGCRPYYRMLNKKKNLANALVERELKWHNELGKTFGVQFWNNCYAFTSSIKNDNKIKWQQYQIVRNCQFTNKRVHKFKNNVSPLCTYCGLVEETISHLYFDCSLVSNFWQELHGWLGSLNINFLISINYYYSFWVQTRKLRL